MNSKLLFRGILVFLALISFSVQAQEFTGTTGAIPDNSCPTGANFTATVAGVDDSYSAIAVKVNITHTWDADLEITLVAPDGSSIDLSSDNGGSGDNYADTIFSASATTPITSGSAPFTGTYLPEEGFDNLYGVETDGTWTLRICDDASFDTGTLNSWSVLFGLPPLPPEPPSNDLCADAEPIACGDVVTGDTTNATGDGSLPFCGTSATASPGVWYVFNGTGDMIDIIASTEDSDFDTKLFVFSGSCGDLVCVDGDDDGGPGLTSEVNFMTEPGVDYYIYVTGFFSTFSGPRFGPYSLSISCALQVEIDEDCNTVYYGYGPESCATLTVEAGYGTPPYSYVWSTGETDTSIEVCPSETTVYSVTVTDAAGNTATDVSTVVAVNVICGNPNNDGKILICHRSSDGSENTICVAPSAVQAHLDHGDSLGTCGSLTCDTPPACDVVISPANGSTDVSTLTDISWSSPSGYAAGYTVSVGTSSGGTDVADNVDVGSNTSYDPGTLDFNTTYYVSVTPYNPSGVAEGCAEISFTTELSPCDQAVLVECGSVVNGSTVGQNAVDFDSTCLISDIGDWYRLIGDGSQVTVSVTTLNYDVEFAIARGDCENLENVECVDDVFTGNGTETTQFLALEGEVYYVYIGHWLSSSTTTGEYILEISCDVPPTPPCESAEEVFCGSVVNGSTDGVDGVDFDSTCTMSDYGKWYKFTGDGSLYTIEATTSGYDIEMAITSGECPNLSNIACRDSTGSSGTESYELQSEAGTTYYIYIAHWSSISTTTGNYTLTISCGDPLPPAPDEFNVIDCTSGPESYSYCYDSNDLFTWTFSSSDGSPIVLNFASGELETSFSGTWDDMLIYDGTDSSGVLLFNSDSPQTGDLSGLSFTGLSGNLYLTFDSDSSVSCQSTSSIDSWFFDVSCSSAPSAANQNGIDEVISWSLSPNPTIGTVDLDLKNFVNSDVMIELVDFTGKVLEVHSLKNLQNPKYRMQLNGQLTNGMYLVRLSSSSDVSAKRLLLNR